MYSSKRVIKLALTQLYEYSLTIIIIIIIIIPGKTALSTP
jgi:hypothetical protein